jgi:hypothetical protein
MPNNNTIDVVIAWDRDEDDVCEAGTIGCAVCHDAARGEVECQPW